VVFLVGLVVLSPLVSAGPVRDFTEDVLEGMGEVLSPIFVILLDTDELDDFLFTKILVVLLLFVIIFTVLKRVELFERVKGVSLTVALIISIISIRFISKEGFFAGILLPYGVLGISILTFLPFLVYFWFVHQSVNGSFGRRIAWILFGVVFLLVWATRPAELLSGTSNLIYLLGLLAILISLIFDRTIHGYFGSGSTRRIRRRGTNRRVARLQAELEHLSNVRHPTREQEEEIRDLIHDLKRLHGI